MNYRHEISIIETDFRTKSQSLTSLNDKIHNLNKNISVASERIKSLENNISRFNDNIVEYNSQREEIETNIIEFNKKIDELNKIFHEKENLISEKKSLVEKEKDALDEKRNEFKILSNNFNSEYQNNSKIQNEISNSNRIVDSLNNKISKLNLSIQQITSEIAKSVGYLEELENEKSNIELKLKESEEAYTTNSDLKEQLEEELSELTRKELEEKNNIISIKEKIDFYQELITNLEGVSQGTKSLLESEGWTKNKKLILADIGSPVEDYRLPVETALKNVINNIIVNDLDELENAIKYLKKNELGKASFILKSNDKAKSGIIKKLNSFSLSRQAKKIQKDNSFINWVIDIISSDKTWKPYFELPLKNIALVKTFSDAKRLFKKYSDFTFVTVDGEIINHGGIIEANYSNKVEDSLFGRRKLLDDLKNEYPKLEINLQKLQSLIEEKEEQISRINLKVISDQGKILLNEINNIEKQISQLEYEKEKSGKDIEKIQNEIQESVAELTLTSQTLQILETDLINNYNFIESEKQKLDEFEQSLQMKENHFAQLQSEYNSLQIELERIKGENQNQKSLLTKSIETKISLTSSIERLTNDIDNAHSEISSINSVINENNIEYDELVGEKNQLNEELIQVEQKLNEKKNEASEFEKKLNDVRNQRQTISDSIHDIQVKENEISLRFENLFNHIKDEYSIELTYKDFNDIDNFDFREVNSEVHSLRERLKNLGPINLLAYSEYEEENERLQFLLQQREDLIESEKDLIRTIKEINESAQSVFLETFQLIRTNFQKIFQTLFNPGDEADLILEEDVDPLEAKIEIVAKPKG